MPAQVAAMRSITAAILLLSLLSHKNSGFPEGKPLGFDKILQSTVNHMFPASATIAMRHDRSRFITMNQPASR